MKTPISNNLREKAEASLKKKQAENAVSRSETDVLKLLFELEVQQIALEMQNEELQIGKEKAEIIAEKYTSLYDFAPIGYFILDSDYIICQLNHSGAKMLGKERSKLVDRNFNLYITPDSRKELSDFFRKISISNENEFCEVQLMIDNKPTTYVHIEGAFLDSEERFLLNVVDISQRKHTEHALKETESNYRKLVKKMPDGVYKSTHDGVFVDANPAMVKLLGYDSKEELLVIDIKNELYLKGTDRDNITLDDLNQELGIYQLRKKDGSIIWVEDHGWYSFNNSGRITFHEGVMRDVTERVQKEKELIIAKERAEQSDRLKSAFLANMSHEIRTPMNGIMGFAELLKQPDLTRKKQKNYINIIEKSGERMLNIINDIVSISKIESGLMEVNIQGSNINEQLDYIYTFFKPEVEGKGMQLLVKKSLPSKEANINTDREKVFAILLNFVKNAIKYSDKGNIEFGYHLKGQCLEFYVKDTGIGIPKDRQEAVFERFIQAEAKDKMARQGAGLGLAISKAYVEMLGGKLWLESEEGKGSTFYFTLPYHTVTSVEKSKTVEILPPIHENLIKNLKIVIAEDDGISKMLISIAVKEFKREIIYAKNGLEAVEACRNNPDVDLVLMDIQMPMMDGNEATRQIRTFNKEVIIIAQTAFAFEGDREKSIAAGCNDYAAKPLVADDLKQLINKYLKK